MSLTYSNPRREAVFHDWPFGATQRTTATFTVETDRKGQQRVSRVTVDPRTARHSAPKRTTYAKAARIVDGSDGKTYIASLPPFSMHISIMQSNMQFSQEAVAETDERFAALRAMFD